MLDVPRELVDKLAGCCAANAAVAAPAATPGR